METHFARHPLLTLARLPAKGKIVSAAEAVRLIRDGDTVAIDGFAGIGVPEGLLIALEERFLKGDSQIGDPPGQPHNLSRLRKRRGSPVALAVTSSLIRLACGLGRMAEFLKLQPNLHQSIAISPLS